jgi:tRNA dimethylallyltransferase
MLSHNLVIIAGPTAVGKTSLAISLARLFNAEIINADSRQVFREMRIGTAVPSDEQLNAIHHHCIIHRSIHEPYNASMFESGVIDLLTGLFENNNIVIMTGGSGLYIDAVCRGIDDIPHVDHETRERLRGELGSLGLSVMQERLKKVDPDYYSRVDLNNSKRIMKALEISEMTGRPYSSFLTGKAKTRNFRAIKIGLDIPREELHNRINGRVDQMMKEGLLAEAKRLYPFRYLNALNTVGYREIFDYLDSKYSLEEAVDRIKAHSRQYARRQLTWFRKDTEIRWFHPSEEKLIREYLLKEIHKKDAI